MKRFFILTTLMVVFIFVPKIVFGTVLINEIAWMGTEISTSNEWIELYNNNDFPIDIKNWSIYGADTGQCLNFSNADGYINSIIPASGYLIYANHKTDLETSMVDIWDATIGMNNSSPGQLILYDALNCTGNIIDIVNQSTKWLAGNNTTKQTMERKTGGWQTSLNPGGTPKTQNSSGATEESEQTTEKPEAPTIPTGNNPPIAEAGDNIIAFIGQEIKFDGTKSTDPDNDELAYSWNMGDGRLIEKPTLTYIYNYPGTYLVTLMIYDGLYYVSDTIEVKIQTGQITINEFLPNPSGKDEEEEWIEIYNDSDSIVDISGWQLDDEASGSEPFIFPQNTLIAPKNYIVFSRQITGIALNNDKDSVRLLLPEGVVFQKIDYGKPPQGKSSARTSEGFVWSAPTPGIANLSIGASGMSASENKNFIYQQPIKSELTKEPSRDYVINYQNANQPEIEGGYAVLPAQEEPQQQDTKSQLATAKESISKQSPLQLILIIAAIIIAGLIIGLLLVKFRKKYP